MNTDRIDGRNKKNTNQIYSFVISHSPVLMEYLLKTLQEHFYFKLDLIGSWVLHVTTDLEVNVKPDAV